jgi:hypothetical protein
MAGGKCVGSPKLPCQKPKISGRFGDLVVKCGDQVDLRADATNIPDKTPTIFNIRHYTKKQTVATEKALLKSSKVSDKKWISKKVFQGWDPPHLDFKVSANGASADSDNRLRIYEYPDFASYTKTIARQTAAGDSLRDGKFDVEFKKKVLTITIKIKLINRLGKKPGVGQPMPAAGPPVDDKLKRSLKKNIESKLSEKWGLHRDRCLREKKCNCQVKTECCKFKIQIQVKFVENGEHYTVNLFQGKGRADSINWCRIPTRANTYAHETGHLLGWYDEYADSLTHGPAPWMNNRPGAIMNTGFKVPQLYYMNFKGEFRLKTDEPWEFFRP